MSLSIFSMRWYGIKGETIEPGSKYQVQCIRVQTTKDGAWQALNDKELEQLLMEHNKNLPTEKAKGPYKADPVGKVLRDAVRKPIVSGKYKTTKFPEVDQTPVRAAKKAAMEKLYGKKKKKAKVKK